MTFEYNCVPCPKYINIATVSQCEQPCPFGIAIRQNMKQAKDIFKDQAYIYAYFPRRIQVIKI